MSFKLHLIFASKPLVFMQIRCNFPDISYLSETQKNNFQFLNKIKKNTGKGAHLGRHRCTYI